MHSARVLPVLALTGLLLVGACSDPRPVEGGLIVAASIPPHAWLVEQIAGDDVAVRSLVQAGDDPHTYMPADAEVSEVMRARIWFRAGLAFEDGSWSRALASAPDVVVVDLREGVELRTLSEQHHEAGGHEAGHGAHEGVRDPHHWLSPRNLSREARTVAEALARLDPEHAEGYAERLAAFQARCTAVDEKLRAALAGREGRRMYVFHPAWGYFCDAYGLVQVPIELAGKAPSEAELTRLIDLAADDDASVIFVQPQIRGAPAVALAEAVGAKIEYLDPLEGDVLANLERVAQAVAAALR